MSSTLKNRAAFWSDWLLSRHYILLFTDSSCVMFYCVFWIWKFIDSGLIFWDIYNLFSYVVVQSLSCVWLLVTPLTAACQAFLSFTVSGVCSSSCPLSRWFYPSFSSSATSFSFCLQSLQAAGSFPMRWLFESGGQSIGVSIPVSIQGWFPLGLAHLVMFKMFKCFPYSSLGKESASNAGDPSSIPGSGRSPGEGIGYQLQYTWFSLVAQLVKNLPAMWETWIWYLGWEDLLGKGKVTHSSILAWRIPWTTVHRVTKSQTWLNDFHFTSQDV